MYGPLDVARRALPTGTVTFLFTDIEGSTQLVHEHGPRYGELLALHHRLLRGVWQAHGGVEVDTAGDAFFVAFADARAATAAARAAQDALAQTPLRVRMGLHTDDVSVGETGYFGLPVHRAARIAAVAHGGQVLLSESTRALAGCDARDLGLHRLKDLRAPERLFQLGGGEFPPLRSLYATNLPVQPSPLIGRARELEEIASLIQAGERLVTLVGAGGSGKTRLALHTAAELVDDFRDGVWFVPLAPVSDPALVRSSIATALGARGDLADALRLKRLLLVLDNFEQVVAAAGEVAALLAEHSELHVLATSRQRLAVAAEREVPVAPLPADDAVGLFVDRARRRGRSVESGERLRALVQALDGLPLAIELAAARVTHLTVEQIAERVSGSIDLLRGDARDAPDRQRTLRATIAWSHDLLSAEDAALFARLAVFPGGFDLEAAEQVAGATVEGLASLVDQSLLRSNDNGRFFMLETIHAFAAERLAALPDADGLRLAHARYYLGLARALDPALRGALQATTSARFDDELPNVRAALDVLHAGGEARLEAALVGACAYYWYMSGQIAEGRERACAAYERVRGADSLERAWVANALALLSFMSGDREAARRYAEEALVLARRHGDAAATMRALVNRSSVAAYEDARSANHELIETARALGDDWYLSLGLGNLGVCERELGDLRGAAELFEEALALARRLDDAQLTAGWLCNLAHTERRLGRFGTADVHFRDALQVIADRPVPEMLIWCLDGLASISTALGTAQRGAVLLGAAERVAGATGYAHPETRAELEQTREALVAALGEKQTAELLTQGGALDERAAVAFALGVDPGAQTE